MKRVVMVFVIAWAGSFIQLHAQTKNKIKPTSKIAAISPLVLKNGQNIYNKYCLACHMADGGGVQGMNPPVIKTTYVLGDKTRLINIILKGMAEGAEIDGETYNNVMPSHKFLTDQEVADVLTYVRNSFGNQATAITAAEVKKIRPSKK